MLILNNGDKLRGNASIVDVIDYTVHGLVGDVLSRFADGQLSVAESNLYPATNTVVITSIVLVNTDTVSRTVNLYIQPDGGTSRHIITKDLNLEAGASLHYDGIKVDIIGQTSEGTIDHSDLSNLDYTSAGHTGFQPSGDYSTVSELTTLSGALKNDIDDSISDTEYGDSWDGITTIAPSKNVVYDKMDTLSRFHDYTESSILVSGGEFSEGTVSGTLKVTAITALLRDEDSETGTLVYVTKAEEDNISLVAQNTIYLVVLNYNGGSLTISLEDGYPNLTQNINIGIVMDNTDTNHFMTGEGGMRLHNFPQRSHLRNIELRASELASGSVPSYTGTNNFTITPGIVYAGTNRGAWGSYDSTTDKFVYIYRANGDGDFTFVPDQTTIDYAHYDDGDGILGEVGVSKYSVHWVYRTYDGCVHIVYGYGGDYSLEQAEDVTAPSIPDFLSAFGLLIGKIIAPHDGGSFTTVQMVTDTFFSGTAVSAHNDLGGLDVGDYQHLTAAQKTDLTDGNDSSSHKHDDRYYTESEVDDLITTVSGKLDDHNEMNNLDYASSGHIGFASSDTLSMASATELTLVSGTVTRTQTLHRIDTEGDVVTGDLDTILGGTDGDIVIIRAENGARTVTLKDGTGNLKLGGRDLELLDTNMAVMLFYSEILSQWLLIGDGGGSATAAVSDDAFSSAWDGGTAVAPSRNAVYDIMVTKSDTGHLHDDRYYTEAEVDTISGSLSSEIDSDISVHEAGSSHDSRYYTETELDNGQLDTRYYTESEVTTISGTLQTDIDTKLENVVEDTTPGLGGDLSCGGYNIDNVGKFCSSSIATQIYNNTGSTLVGGTAVTICGLNEEICTVCVTDNREATKMPACGIIYADIVNGGEGCGIRLGRINMDTSGMAGEVEDRLYVQGDGSLDTIIPTSGMVQRVGFLVKKASGNAGRICVCIRGPRSAYSAKDQHPIIRMGDDAGHKKIVFKDYINNEVAAFDDSGNLTLSGTIDGVDVATLKSDYDSHEHDDLYYMETEVDSLLTTLSGNLSNEIDSDIVIHSSSGGHDGRYYTEVEVDTISGSLQANIDSKASVLVDLNDTPNSYDTGKYLRSTISGTEWATVSGTGTSDVQAFLDLTDTPTTYSGYAGRYLKVSLDESELEYATIQGTATTTISGWDVYDATTYYGDFEHNLGTEELSVFVIDTATNKEIGVEDIEIINENKVRIYILEDTLALKINIITGSLGTEHNHDSRYYTESEIDTLITTGIADDNLVQIDDTDTANNDYAKFTTSGIEGRNYSEVLGDLSGQASTTFSFNDKGLQKANLLDCGIVTNEIGSIGGGSQTIDIESGNSVSAIVDTAETTFTFNNPTVSGALCAFSFVLTNGGSQTINWPASADWEGGTAPTLTASGVDILVFSTIDGGTDWHGGTFSLDSK